jgi:hypothetical protein
MMMDTAVDLRSNVFVMQFVRVIHSRRRRRRLITVPRQGRPLQEGNRAHRDLCNQVHHQVQRRLQRRQLS